MCNRSMLTLLFGIVLVDMNSAQEHVTIEQTNGYKDTWINMSSACSLLGVGLKGNTWKNKVSVDNIDEITGTGWISAHVERQGTLQFVGCEYGAVYASTPRLEVTHDRIPECIYFCGSSSILLHRNHCYCTSNVYLHNLNCMASRCGNNEPLFCGQSEVASSKCMCRYNKYFGPNISNNLMDGSCKNVKMNCRLRAQYPFLQHIQTWHVICWKNHVQCDFDWNGYVMSEEFYWGTSSSAIGNQDNCVAIRRVSSSQTLTLITLLCSSKQTGICIKGSRISTTPHTTLRSTVIFLTTGGYELHSSELTSHKVAEHTTNDIVTNHQSTTDDTPILNITTMLNRIESITYIDGLASAKSTQSFSKSMKTDQTNNLGPILGGVGTFVLLVIFGVVIIVILMRKRRRKADAGSQPSQEINSLPTCKQHQNQYVNHVNEHRGGVQLNRAVDTGDYDSLKKGRTQSENAVYDLCDHTSEAGDNMYGRWNQNGRGTVSPENADIYDHSRTVVQVNGDTYDSLKTGSSREDSSADYYDHTYVGEDYGYLEKGCSRNGQVDDIYDHTRGNGNSNGETFDTFQIGRGREDASEDCYDHTGVSAEYGCLQKGSKVTVLGDNDYDTVKVAKEDVQLRKCIL